MSSASVHLFVYGSLKRGGRHHDELEGATFLGLAETAPGYRLETWGEYLAMLADAAAADTVPGELFEVPLSKLPDLDAFEGDAYERTQVPVRLAAQAQPERHETTAAQAKPERNETPPAQAQAQPEPERHETAPAQAEAQPEPERHATDNSAETRLALAYLRKAR